MINEVNVQGSFAGYRNLPEKVISLKKHTLKNIQTTRVDTYIGKERSTVHLVKVLDYVDTQSSKETKWVLQYLITCLSQLRYTPCAMNCPSNFKSNKQHYIYRQYRHLIGDICLTAKCFIPCFAST